METPLRAVTTLPLCGFIFWQLNCIYLGRSTTRFDTRFLSGVRASIVLYQSIIAPLLAALIGFYYGYAGEDQTRFDCR
jgi:hypothetical protein